MILDALAPADRAALYRLGEALHRAAAIGERRWTAFPDVRSRVEGLMAALRADCSAADAEEVARRLVGMVDYREGGDAAIELALTEILVHGVRWSWERC
ncbi:hypothetical protein IYX23_09230 [Methylocystis sp. L43]|uniref:hypothetical protein n=1 Tax=unclassified Methylocystis TaxID=2625913 RepID=UPI0018C202F0|nr:MULTISPECIES: hypothetical protein [unclassified Methylocystis]MBG0797852.1 hypothetical protein [Methylocystis sp. L43]MBG0806086.1 hypothetical protein [Methylocystis sp. H15]